MEPEREQTIARITGARPVVAAALDGPIRQGFDIIGRYRTAERMLTRRLGQLIGKPGQSSSPVGKLLNQHANECARYVESHAFLEDAKHGVPINRKAIVEAFPSSFLGMMIEDPGRLAARRGDRSDTFFSHLAAAGILTLLVEHCLRGRSLGLDPNSIVNHDDRAAFICALTALCIAASDFVAVGDDDGWIVLPPMDFIQRAQRELLCFNASEEATSALHVKAA